MLDDAEPGKAEVLGGGAGEPVNLLEPVKLGHKVALVDIPEGHAITKFGETIGRATRLIERGAWVHLHNVTSDFDERSKTLDVHSGAVTDTKYE